MDCYQGQDPDMMILNDPNDMFNGNQNTKPLQCHELMPIEKPIIDEGINHVNNYTILPAVNLCPITWGIANLETVETIQNEFLQVENVVSNTITTSNTICRVRKKLRPYSPSEPMIFSNKKSMNRKRVKPRIISIEKITPSNEVYIDRRTGLPFSCDKCESPHIVDPTRCSPGNRKRPPMPRKYIDPVSGRIMLLCNACGIAAKTNRKARTTEVGCDPEKLRHLRDEYLSESIKFSKNLSFEWNEPELANLYCPFFTTKGCNCIKKYLSSDKHSQGQERQMRVLELLSYHRKARELSRNKSCLKGIEEEYNVHSENELHIDDCEENFLPASQKPHYRRKSKDFEHFVLASRLKLRSEYVLCEKATQKILLYSNNFLHKKLKSAAQRGSRIQKTLRRNARLIPIGDMHKENCCSNGCTRIATSHANLLEDWRNRASLGQKDARRVIAEMLTPTGGTKANCQCFVKMVTGCCVATISAVNVHMRKTKGIREPPEHGLKRYWRKNSKPCDDTNKDDRTVEPKVDVSATELTVPSEEQLLSMGTAEASMLLQVRKQQLDMLQNQLKEAEFRLRAATETIVADETPPDLSPSLPPQMTTEIPQENLIADLRPDEHSNIFVLGSDGVIRSWKSDPSYVHIVTQSET